MNILITNDDGIHAKGINKLYETLSKKHSVYMFAPHTEKSACSNALTIRNQVRVDFVTETKFAVHGFPADCVNVGIHSNLCPEIDMIVSGINHGPNLGDDVHFSGTVAGARSGYFFGKNSLAISIDSYSDVEYIDECAEFVAGFIETSPYFKMESPTLINVNYPKLPKSEIKGEKITRLGRRFYNDKYVVTEKSDSHISFILEGTIDSAKGAGLDCNEISNGYITVTPLTVDSTHEELYKKYTNE